eukprot:89115-Pyramimonas_sp.AAC.1
MAYTRAHVHTLIFKDDVLRERHALGDSISVSRDGRTHPRREKERAHPLEKDEHTSSEETAYYMAPDRQSEINSID